MYYKQHICCSVCVFELVVSLTIVRAPAHPGYPGSVGCKMIVVVVVYVFACGNNVFDV